VPVLKELLGRRTFNQRVGTNHLGRDISGGHQKKKGTEKFLSRHWKDESLFEILAMGNMRGGSSFPEKGGESSPFWETAVAKGVGEEKGAARVGKTLLLRSLFYLDAWGVWIKRYRAVLYAIRDYFLPSLEVIFR